jgi:hypothetical protein
VAGRQAAAGAELGDGVAVEIHHRGGGEGAGAGGEPVAPSATTVTAKSIAAPSESIDI